MYYGSHTISEVKDIEDGLVRISFESEKDEDDNEQAVKDEVTSRTMLEAVQTEEPSDATQLEKTRLEIMKNDVMKVLASHNMYSNEWPKVAEQVQRLLVDAIEQADELAWGEPHYRKSIYLCNTFLKKREMK